MVCKSYYLGGEKIACLVNVKHLKRRFKFCIDQCENLYVYMSSLIMSN